MVASMHRTLVCVTISCLLLTCSATSTRVVSFPWLPGQEADSAEDASAQAVVPESDDMTVTDDTTVLEPVEETIVLEPEEETAVLEPVDDSVIWESVDDTAVLEPVDDTAVLEPVDDSVIWESVDDTVVLDPVTPDPVFEDPALSSLANEALVAHNNYRALHGVPDLVWDTAVEQSAQAWADGCRIPLEHSSGTGFGENLAWGYGSMTAAIDAWYSEIDQYDYGNPGFTGGTGHFTQIVWKDTKRLGCAMGYCPDVYGGYWVCQYDPPGNYLGNFGSNVLPLI
mmetsp:Transcript_8027/g.20596  ORF Transcript_8027/g.20596 Transcript_8027/m.20596 type:complete len:283 (+) Transcript_8027:204-1052(+)